MANGVLRFWFAVAIGVAACPALAQEPEIPADALIRLQRTSCYGPCPIYTVAIDARGTVTNEGERFVRVVGRWTVLMIANDLFAQDTEWSQYGRRERERSAPINMVAGHPAR